MSGARPLRVRLGNDTYGAQIAQHVAKLLLEQEKEHGLGARLLRPSHPVPANGM